MEKNWLVSSAKYLPPERVIRFCLPALLVSIHFRSTVGAAKPPFRLLLNERFVPKTLIGSKPSNTTYDGKYRKDKTLF